MTASHRGAEYLSGKIDKITDPFQMAITTYALHVTRHGARAAAFSLLQKMQRKSKSPSTLITKPNMKLINKTRQKRV